MNLVKQEISYLDAIIFTHTIIWKHKGFWHTPCTAVTSNKGVRKFRLFFFSLILLCLCLHDKNCDLHGRTFTRIMSFKWWAKCVLWHLWKNIPFVGGSKTWRDKINSHKDFPVSSPLFHSLSEFREQFKQDSSSANNVSRKHATKNLTLYLE